MNPPDFINTIYLGDRACKGLKIESWNKIVRIHVDLISRVRDPSGRWNYYVGEDIEDGEMVFTDVDAFSMTPPGLIPNDYIDGIEIIEIIKISDGKILYIFEVNIGSVDSDPKIMPSAVILRITASGVHLEDPKKPGVMITE